MAAATAVCSAASAVRGNKHPPCRLCVPWAYHQDGSWPQTTTQNKKAMGPVTTALPSMENNVHAYSISFSLTHRLSSKR
eukprot:6099942-Prorocentrum_lima.AAC.1